MLCTCLCVHGEGVFTQSTSCWLFCKQTERWLCVSIGVSLQKVCADACLQLHQDLSSGFVWAARLPDSVAYPVCVSFVQKKTCLVKVGLYRFSLSQQGWLGIQYLFAVCGVQILPTANAASVCMHVVCCCSILH